MVINNTIIFFNPQKGRVEIVKVINNTGARTLVRKRDYAATGWLTEHSGRAPILVCTSTRWH